MKIVIDIDEKDYQMCRHLLGDADAIERAIANGQVLPKDCQILTHEAYSELCLLASKELEE